MILICVCLSFITILFTSAIVCKNRREFDKSVRNMLVGIVVTISILIFPMYRDSYDFTTSTLFSTLYALRALSGCQSVDLSHKIVIDGWLYYAYYALLYCMFIIAPIFTTSFLISIFGNLNDKIRFRLITANELHIFSELNESAVLLCESLDRENAQFIFCNTKLTQADKNSELVKRARKIGAIILDVPDTELQVKKDFVWFYQLSDDRNYNINSTIEIVEKFRSETDKCIRIVVFSSDTTDEILLDSIDKGSIRIKLVDEVKYSCYTLFDRVPLFEGAKNNKISALLVGCGRTGMEMLKAMIWCGQISGFDFEINIIDNRAIEREKEFILSCPDVSFEKYGIRFINANVNSSDFKLALEEFCRDTTYVVIATGDDTLNINTAICIRKFFARNDCHNIHYNPKINLRVRTDSKSKQIDSLCSNSSDLYGMVTFGSMEQMFSISNIMSSPLEKMALGVHLAYYNAINGTEQQISDALSTYYMKEYNQRASFAGALHIKYKLFSCGIHGISGDPISEEQIREFEERISNANTLDSMALLEHERWNAFMRTEGYSPSTPEQVDNYKMQGNKTTHINQLAKLHPALVEWNQLDQVSESIGKVMNKTIDFKQSDYDIIRQIPNILRIRNKNVAFWN